MLNILWFTAIFKIYYFFVVLCDNKPNINLNNIEVLVGQNKHCDTIIYGVRKLGQTLNTIF